MYVHVHVCYIVMYMYVPTCVSVHILYLHVSFMYISLYMCILYSHNILWCVQVIESPNVDDLTNMPSEVIAELKHVLKKESSGYGDNACRAFMLAMVSMIGGYRKALKFREVNATWTLHTTCIEHVFVYSTVYMYMLCVFVL